MLCGEKRGRREEGGENEDDIPTWAPHVRCPLHLSPFLLSLPLSLLSSWAGHVKRRGHHHGDLRQQGAGAAERDGEVVTDGGLLQHRQPHVRIPSEAAATVRRRGRWATQSSVGGEDGDAAMVVSPHKVVARRAAAHSSVLEGAGRMLKGCDLHHVRNAVLCRTGFLD
nr:uncharacterized protein LOC107280824 [Oryza sativa Japonica Group]